MTALSIQPTYPIFSDRNGAPLENGYVWIGAANLDPQGNPINVYWDAALTIAATQPIRTLAGYPSNSGTPARLYVNSDYSIQVLSKNGSPVYSAAAATERYSDVVVGGVDSSEVSYLPAGTGAVARTAQAKMRDVVSVKDFGASTTASASVNAAAINAAIQANLDGEIVINETYSIDATINLNGFSGIIRFTGNGSGLQAAANNLKVFQSTTNAYGCRIIDARVIGTGYTGVYAFDLTRFQLRGAEIVRPVILDCEYGIYLRSLCWGLKIDHPETNGVAYPITLVEGCNAVEINHPGIDDFSTVGIWIKTGGLYPNVGNLILNGHVQNGTEGIVDQGIQTQVIGTYFEGCTVSDIALKTGSGNFYGCATNHTATGNRAYLGESADAAMIVHPFMSNSARTIGLFDFDGACTNCYYDVIFGDGSRNLPLGTVTGIKPISNKPGPIGGVTPDDGKFSTLSSTGITEFAQARSGALSQVIATATPTTYFTAAVGMYVVHAYIEFSGGPAQYTAQAFVLCDGSGARIIANNGSSLTITLSGLNVQVTQTSGGNQTVLAGWLRVI